MTTTTRSSPSWWTYIQRRKTRNYIFAGLFVLPAVVNFLIFRYIPIIWAARASTWQYSLLGGYRDWIGADHYLRALEDPVLLKSLQVTFMYVIVKLPLEVALALALAIFTNRAIRGMGTMRTIVFTPVVMSMVVAMLPSPLPGAYASRVPADVLTTSLSAAIRSTNSSICRGMSPQSGRRMDHNCGVSIAG